jgi:hypothetical protein
MSTILIVLAAMLACALIAGWLYRRRTQRRYRLPFLMPLRATTRKLAQDERDAVENYLEILNRTSAHAWANGCHRCARRLALNEQSDTVLCVTRAITRYGITPTTRTNGAIISIPSKCICPFWEQYINDENSVELIHTDSCRWLSRLTAIPERISSGSARFALERASSTQASIRGEETEQIELLNIRQETHEEHALSRPDGMREAMLIVASFLLFFSAC